MEESEQEPFDRAGACRPGADSKTGPTRPGSEVALHEEAKGEEKGGRKKGTLDVMDRVTLMVIKMA